MQIQNFKKLHMYVSESAITKFAFEPANMQLLELSHKEHSTHMLTIFKEIKERIMLNQR